MTSRHDKRLSPEEFMPYAPSAYGTQVNVHHCRLGKDNDRMYVRRNDDGSVVAFCHHCNGRGYRKSETSRSRPKDPEEVRKSNGPGPVRLPDDFTTDVDGAGRSPWSPQAKAWVRQYGVTDDELVSNSVGYSRLLGGVVFPVFGPEGTPLFYQYRPVDTQVGRVQREEGTAGEAKSPPKYVSVGKRSRSRDGGLFRTVPSWHDGTVRNDGTDIGVTRAVLVEDVISAIIVSRVPGCQGIALMGSGLSDRALRQLATEYDDFVVFLDNDNSEVRASQRKLNKVLSPLIPGECRIICSDRDPKEHRLRELMELLEVKDHER